MAWAATAVGAAGLIFGAVKAGKENKNNKELLKQRKEEASSEAIDVNRSFLDTNVAKDAVKVQTENLQDGQKAVAGRAAITGASDEAIVAGNSNVQKNFNDGISRIAAAGTQFQSNEKRMNLGRQDNIDNQQMAFNQQKADGAASLMGNASDMFKGITYGMGMNEKNKDSQGS